MEYARAGGFYPPPGGSVGSRRHSYNIHAYCCELDDSICAKTGEPEAQFDSQCDEWIDYEISQRLSLAKRDSIPVLLTEFGACMNTEQCVKEITRVTDVAEKQLFGWAYWEFKTY